MKYSIAIVGSGAAAVSLLYCYLQKSKDHNHLPKTIYLFDGRSSFGTGAAYEEDLKSNLLNTKAGSASPFHDRTDGFYRWLLERKDVWHRLYGELPFDEHTYMPRSIFGLYLQNCLEDLLRQAEDRAIEVVRINAQVTDARRSRHGYVLRAGHGLVVNADYLFLCCGTPSARTPPRLAKARRFIATPYPLASLVRKIPKHASVGVIGSRLSCIDAVIGLIEQGHTGKVVIHSRSGYFPCVRGTQGRTRPKLLSAESIDARSPRDLAGLVDLFSREVALQGGVMGGLSLPEPPDDLAAFLRKELVCANSERPWQAVLYSTNSTIERIWGGLDDGQKGEFMNRYFSAFMAYRVSIPAENAKKILGYLESGQLEFRRGDFDISADSAENLSIVMREGNEEKLDYDVLVNATGSPRDVLQVNSPLIEALLAQGIVTPHQHGGIVVNASSYQVVDRAGQADDHLYALGELTNGVFFFTSALEIIARHARLCINSFASGLGKTDEKSHSVSAA
jgi:uncharacterized NAD(P)/FAD-binding protein YdhS